MDKQLLRESIKRELRQRILSGELQPGARIPSELELVRQLGVGRSQTRAALVDLEDEGLIIRRQGSGSFVAPDVGKDQPNPGLRYDTVKVVIPEYRSQYVRDLIEAFMSEMFAAGMKVTAFHSQFDAAEETAYLSLADRMGVAGLVVWPVHNTEPARRAISRLFQQRFPVVLIDRDLPGCNVDVVRSDHRAIGGALATELLTRGHRRIAIGVSATDTASSIRERVEGAKETIQHAGDGAVAVETVPLSEAGTDHADQIARVMARRERPTAFLCINDDMAAWVEHELDLLGWRGLGEIELACVRDGSPEFRGLFPTIAVQQDGRAVGLACAQSLAARIADPGRPPSERLIPCSPAALLA